MSLRVLTYNISDGGHGREHIILELLQAHQPDVVFLQELFSPTNTHDLPQNLDMQYFFAEGNSRRHLALLSRLPIMESHSYHPISSKRTFLGLCLNFSSAFSFCPLLASHTSTN